MAGEEMAALATDAPIQHGTHRAYNIDRCRCPICRAFKSEYTAEPARRAAASTPERKLQKLEAFYLRTYNITLADKAERLEAQGGVCAKCGTDEPGGRWNTFATDHNHATNQLRGELCNPCNKAIGALGDNVAGVREALDYLEQYE